MSYLNILWDCDSWYCAEAILLDYRHLIILISAATHISNIYFYLFDQQLSNKGFRKKFQMGQLKVDPR